jgi:CRP-like cAMP-binding protein
MLDAVPLFVSLTEEEKLAPTMTRRTYPKGEVLAEQGTKLSSLVVIRTGVLIVSRQEGATEVELSRLSSGDHFEGGLFTGSGEPDRIRAMTFAVVHEVGQAALAELMRDRPDIADEIAVTLSQRAKALPGRQATTTSPMHRPFSRWFLESASFFQKYRIAYQCCDESYHRWRTT